MRRAIPLIALLLLGCLPDLSQWRVLRPDEDGGPPPRPDAGHVMPASCDDGAIPIGAGYREGFESGAAGWGVTGQNASWGLGTPSGPVVLGAAEGVNAWMAGLDAPYSANEDSYVVSPCFDASASTSDLFISLSRAYKTESSYDRARVELSVDGGLSWAPVTGQLAAGWYSGDGWSGEGAWREAFAYLPGTAGQPRVQVRLYFHSDTSQQLEGFAFDDVLIQPARIDLAVSIADDARCGHATATITNVGGAMVPSFEVTTTIDGDDDIRTFDSPLAYGDSREVPFGASLARGLSARAFAVGDVNPGNDSASFVVTNVVFGSGGYFSDFEADDGGFVVGGANASWEWGTPAGALFTGAASGSRAWVTNLDGDYNPNERSWIQTPCYDMRGLVTDPTVSFMQVFRTEDCCDSARVEVSVDGQSFRPVGNTSSGGTNWYNSFGGWRGSSGAGAWRVAQHPLTRTAGFEFVRIRFVLDADSSQQFEGFGVDDVQFLP